MDILFPHNSDRQIGLISTLCSLSDASEQSIEDRKNEDLAGWSQSSPAELNPSTYALTAVKSRNCEDGDKATNKIQKKKRRKKSEISTVYSSPAITNVKPVTFISIKPENGPICTSEVVKPEGRVRKLAPDDGSKRLLPKSTINFWSECEQEKANKKLFRRKLANIVEPKRIRLGRSCDELDPARADTSDKCLRIGRRNSTPKLAYKPAKVVKLPPIKAKQATLQVQWASLVPENENAPEAEPRVPHRLKTLRSKESDLVRWDDDKSADDFGHNWRWSPILPVLRTRAADSPLHRRNLEVKVKRKPQAMVTAITQGNYRMGVKQSSISRLIRVPTRSGGKHLPRVLGSSCHHPLYNTKGSPLFASEYK